MAGEFDKGYGFDVKTIYVFKISTCKISLSIKINSNPHLSPWGKILTGALLPPGVLFYINLFVGWSNATCRTYKYKSIKHLAQLKQYTDKNADVEALIKKYKRKIEQ